MLFARSFYCYLQFLPSLTLQSPYKNINWAKIVDERELCSYYWQTILLIFWNKLRPSSCCSKVDAFSRALWRRLLSLYLKIAGPLKENRYLKKIEPEWIYFVFNLVKISTVIKWIKTLPAFKIIWKRMINYCVLCYNISLLPSSNLCSHF